MCIKYNCKINKFLDFFFFWKIRRKMRQLDGLIPLSVEFRSSTLFAPPEKSAKSMCATKRQNQNKNS